MKENPYLTENQLSKTKCCVEDNYNDTCQICVSDSNFNFAVNK